MKPKKLLSLLLSLALVVGMIPAFGITASATESLPGFSVSKDGVVSWNHVPNADMYYLSGLSSGGYKRIVQNSDATFDKATTTWTSQGVTFDLKQYMDLLKKQAGTYNMTITAVRNGYELDYSSSFQYNYNSSIEKLSRPENPRWEGNAAVWDSVPNATGYIVNLYEIPGNGINIANATVTDTTYLFDKELFSKSYDYFFTVVATADSYLNSEMNRCEAVNGAVLIGGNSVSTFTDFYVYITPPVAGQHPQAPTVKTDDYSVSAYNWVRITDSESKKMTASDVFEEGVFYQCRVDLLVKDGIVGEADELKGYVNGSAKTDGMDVMITRNGSFKVKVIGSYNCHSAKANPFVDVSESDYFYEPVLWAVEKGITNGTDAMHFSPAATCTRGQVVTFLWRAAGSPTPTSTTNQFTDVTPSDYYYNAVLWAVGKNITNGTSATTFGPNAGCTRGQVVTFLHRFENSPKPSSTTNPFVDVSSSEYYYTPVLWAVGKGITNGTDATHFSPNDTCTRGQIVTFLYRDMK